MRILVVGATGTIGSAVSEALQARGHDVVQVGSSGTPPAVNLADSASIEALYAEIGRIDAVVCAAGIARFGALEELDDAAFQTSIDNKLMGQVNLVRSGLGVVREGGSFTLTSGGLSQKPEKGTVAVSMVGAGVEMFARAAALELEGRYRVNVVSPGWVAESRVKAGLDPMPGIWARDLAEHYVDLVEGGMTGQIISGETAKR
jgi:NAD(P)-dependent dehydrogenase (short-subunit alcohol dehydrogenase family)